MSAEQLSGVTGLSRRRVAAIEAGQVDPTFEVLLALADGLGIQSSALVALAEQLKGPS